MSKNAKVIAVTTNKGGVLKTSSVLAVSSVLAKKGYKVLVVDADNQGNIALGFGFNPDEFEYTLYDVLVSGHPAEDAIFNVYDKKKEMKHSPNEAMKNIFVLPSNDDMAFFEFDVLTNKETNPRFKQHFSMMTREINHLRKQFDFILIDSPPNIGAVVGNILKFADEVIIPYKPESYSMRSTLKIITHIEDFKAKENPNLKIAGILPTDVRPTIHHRENIQELKIYIEKSGLNLRVFESEIANSIKYDEVVKNERAPIIFTDNKQILSKYGKLIDVYEKLVEEAFING